MLWLAVLREQQQQLLQHHLMLSKQGCRLETHSWHARGRWNAWLAWVSQRVSRVYFLAGAQGRCVLQQHMAFSCLAMRFARVSTAPGLPNELGHKESLALKYAMGCICEVCWVTACRSAVCATKCTVYRHIFFCPCFMLPIFILLVGLQGPTLGPARQ